MYDFVSGPMVWISVGLFFVGLIVQAYRFFAITRKKAKLYLPTSQKPPKKKRSKGINGLYELFVDIYNRSFTAYRKSIAGTHPVMTIVTVTFHVLLFVTPLFLLAHNTMIKDGLGIPFFLPSFNEHFSDFLTVVFLICAGIFLFRRIFSKRVRSITSFYDYFVLIVTFAPFLTGFLAYHQIFDYRTIILLHMICGELMLILVPFTRLGHALFFFLYRFFIGGEYSFGQGRRVW